MSAGRNEPGQARSDLGLYIHIPFCEKKCPYCDFNTYAGLQSLFQATVDALCQEIARWSQPLTGRTISTIFLGGGTPTILNEAQLAQLFAAVRRNFAVAPDAEITSEANPGAVDRDKFITLRQLGVNRLSLGVQSFQADELRFLRRIHDVADVYQAVEAARSAGFDNINLDFIFGLPEQSAPQWRDTLQQALALAPQHLSLYSLIVEPDTPLAHWVKTGQTPPPDEDLAAEQYEIAIATLAQAGYIQYEISNWAKRQAEDKTEEDAEADKTLDCDCKLSITPSFACKHNLIYWRNFEYLGIGPGAHSHLRHWRDEKRRCQGERPTERRWGNRKSVPGYIKRMQQGAPLEEFSEEIAPADAMGETMMLGLRLLREGVSYAHFRALHQRDLRQTYSSVIDKLQRRGLLDSDDSRVRLSQRGVMVGNQVFMEFLS
jgi:oxygen-independent coproporphyrinogen-3 oxidase